MLTELRQSWGPSAGRSDAEKLPYLHTLAHKQAVDLFHVTKAKIVERALSSQESIGLLGSMMKRSEELP